MPSRRYTDNERKIGLTGLNGQKILVSSRYINRKKFNLLYFSEEKKLSDNLLKLSNDLILKIHIKLLQKNVLYISTILLQLFTSKGKIQKIYNFKFYLDFLSIPQSPPPRKKTFFLLKQLSCVATPSLNTGALPLITPSQLPTNQLCHMELTVILET